MLRKPPKLKIRVDLDGLKVSPQGIIYSLLKWFWGGLRTLFWGVEGCIPVQGKMLNVFIFLIHLNGT